MNNHEETDTGNLNEEIDVADKVYVGDEEFDGTSKQLQVGYTAATNALMHSDDRDWLKARGNYKNDNLDRLAHGETASEVFGEQWKEAFVSHKDIASKNVKLHCGCMDEGVSDGEESLKIGTAGSGVLMTQFDHPRFQTDDPEEIYAFLADPESGDANFWAYVESLKAQKEEGAEIIVSDHAECGAAQLFCNRFPEKNLDPVRVAKAAATRLKRALGLSGEIIHVGFNKGDMHMDRGHVHDAHCLIIDATGRFRADIVKEKMSGLKLSAIAYLPDEHDEEQNIYLRTEVDRGTDIIAGAHGTGIKNAPIVVIIDPSEISRETIEKRFDLARYKGRKIYYAEAPRKVGS